MSSLPLQARSTTELVDAAIQLYRRDPMKYMLLTAIAYAPWVLLQLLLFGGTDPSLMASSLGLLIYVGMFVGYGVMSAALARMAAAAYMGESVEVDDTIRQVMGRVPAVIGATLLKYLVVMVGMVLLVFPGLYLFTRYFATTQAVVLEGTGVRGAFARSTALSKGLKRHIFNTLALAWIIYFVISVAITMMGMAFGETAMTIVSSLVTIVAYPVIGILEVVLYYDARVRQEGYDIEVMAGSLDGAPATV